jgi:SsrA-binding protein
MQIPEYSHAGYSSHEPTRARKLLLHRTEIERLAQRVKEKGLTLVPLRVYFKGQLVKVELGLGRGKKIYDKRQTLAKRDADREMARVRKATSRPSS